MRAEMEALADFVEAHRAALTDDARAYHERVKRSDAVYHGEIVKHAYGAFYYDEDDKRAFEEAGRMLFRLGRAFYKRLEDPALREAYGIDEFEWTCMKKRPVDDFLAPMARIDLFYESPERYQVCEINTDGSSAMLEDAALAREFRKTRAYEAMGGTNADLVEAWAKKLADFATAHGAERIAVTDYLESGNPVEFTRIAEALTRHGKEVEILDAGDFMRKDGRLMGHNGPVDLVYRRLVTGEMLRNPDRAKALVESYLADEVILVGGFHSQTMHTKRFLADLYEHKGAYPADTHAWIDAHIPETVLVRPENRDALAARREAFVVKPVDDYGGEGVAFGRKLDDETFRKRLTDGMVAQTEVHAPTVPVWTYEDDWKKKDMHVMPGLFFYFETFSGVYTRADEVALIAREAYTLPHFYRRRKA